MERDTPYSPQQRTALVLTGTGTAGAYHAGVLRALHEAGVKIDIVAGRGIGAVGALFTAVDAAARLWEPNGIWLDGHSLSGVYEWRTVWRLAGWALAVACAALFLPVVALVLGALVYPVLLMIELLAPSFASGLTAWLSTLLSSAFTSGLLIELVARVSTAAVLVFAMTLAWGFLSQRLARPRRRARGAAWWQALGAPMSTARIVAWASGGFWGFIRGATHVPQPTSPDLSRRYAELLAENLGQPGYRELLMTAHDLDTRRDVIFALVGEPGRGRFFGSAGADREAGRRAELVDLAGAGRDHVMDAVAAALSVPVLTEPHLMTFGVDTFWRGESHRLCDRPAALVRLLEEVSAAGAEQVIVVGADAPVDRAHALSARLMDPRAALADYLAGAETAAARDAVTALFDRFSGVFQVQPLHNPIGAFAFGGAYDERSDRQQTLKELMDRGYEDAYRQFIEPVIGASGEQLERRQGRPFEHDDRDDRDAPISTMLANLD